ncbi:hypothetical protein NS2R_16370 [Pseudomonas oryzihabitans]|nr:hypothetical protein NS2R_16370 [Pseudomonas psychrotolerans]
MLGNIADYLLRSSVFGQALDAADQAEIHAISRGSSVLHGGPAATARQPYAADGRHATRCLANAPSTSASTSASIHQSAALPARGSPNRWKSRFECCPWWMHRDSKSWPGSLTAGPYGPAPGTAAAGQRCPASYRT